MQPFVFEYPNSYHCMTFHSVFKGVKMESSADLSICKMQSHSDHLLRTTIDDFISNVLNTVAPQHEEKQELKAELEPLPFHEKCGLNIRLSDDRCVAVRSEGEFCLGYVFTARTIKPDEIVVVQILRTDVVYLGGLTFGVTSKNPSRMNVNELPEDLNQLGDSFKVYKNVANTPKSGDVLIFWQNETGEIRMKKNTEDQILVLNVEPSAQFYWLFELYGSTVEICAFSSLLDRHKYVIRSLEEDKNPSVETGEETLNNLSTDNKPGPYPSIIVNVCLIDGDYRYYEPMRIELPNQPNGSSQFDAGTQQQRDSLDLMTVNNDGNQECRLKHRVKSHVECSPSGNNSKADNCIVCCENPINCVLYKCGHMCMCYECAKKQWRYQGDGHCPNCRSLISDIVRIYD